MRWHLLISFVWFSWKSAHTCTLCCPPLVLNLGCQCEILFWRNRQAGEASLSVSSRFWDQGRSVFVCFFFMYREGCETCVCWPWCHSSILNTHGIVGQGWNWAGCGTVQSLVMLHPAAGEWKGRARGCDGITSGTNRTNLISQILLY